MDGQAVGEVLLVGVVRPGALHDAVGVFPGDLDRPIRAEAVDNDDFGGDAGEAIQRRGDVPLLVARDDHRRDLHAGAFAGYAFPRTMASRAIRT
jgi:hypothetical protein